MKEQTFDGEWWSTDSDVKVPGTLTWRPGQLAELELLKPLPRAHGATQEHDYGRLSPPPRTILGVARTGDLLTLSRTTQLKQARRWRDGRHHRTETVGAGLTFLGKHLPNGDAAVFRKARMKTPHLTQWANPNPFVYQDDPSSDSEFRMGWTLPPPTQIDLTSGTVELGTEVRSSTGQNRFEVQATSYLEYESNQPIQFDQVWSEFLGPSLGFLSFATHDDQELSSLSVAVGEDGSDAWIQVLSADVSGPDDPEPLRIDGMLLGSHTVFGLDVANTLRRWIEAPRGSLGARDLFLALLGPRRLFGEECFLVLVSAVESLWRTELKRRLQSTEAYEERVRAILDACPSHERDWLSSRLQHGNEPTQKERLEEVIEYAGADFADLTGDPRKFVRAVVDTRNYLIHVDPSGASRAERDPIRLYRIGEVLSLIVEFALRVQLGFSMEARNEILRRYNRYGNLKRQLVRDPLY